MKAGARAWVRKLHRWLGLVIGIQLLLWTVSGLYFSLFPMSSVRGEDRVRVPEPVNFARVPLVTPALAINTLSGETGPSLQVRDVRLVRVLGEPVYQLHYDLGGRRQHRMASALDGELLPPVSRELAVEIARADFSGDPGVLATNFIEAVPVDHEYRGRPLPAWQVRFDDPDGFTVYVAADLGEVTARRNDRWRLFDLMWMLHILDFESRDDFNTLLLQVLAALAIITVASGFVLWCMTTSLFRSR